MTKLLFVGCGGFLGAIARYLLGGLAYKLTGITLFPIGTLAVNVLGCLIIGFLAGLAEFRGVLSGEMRLLLMVGILGGFTTFSSFGYETFQLLRDGQEQFALTSVCLNLLLGIAAVWGGFSIARLM